MQQIDALDRTAFWWINSHHAAFLDWPLWIFSQHWSWLVVILIAYIFTVLRHDRGSWLWVLVGVALCFLLADQISSHVIKDAVQRLRPCHAMEGVRMFHTGKGGLYGFVSSHAANSFAIAMFFSLMYGRRHKDDDNRRWGSVWVPWLMFGWAIVVCYSRSYLGKHYPGDLICGALLGAGVGAVVYFVISRIRFRISSSRVA